MTEFGMVGEFHQKFGLRTSSPRKDNPPSFIDADAFLFRFQFLLEELIETLAAYRAGNMAKTADGLVDLVYVALGTAHLMAIPFDEIFMAVHHANMKKERASGGDDTRSTRGSALDVVKPAGWKAPDVEKILQGELERSMQ